MHARTHLRAIEQHTIHIGIEHWVLFLIDTDVEFCPVFKVMNACLAFPILGILHLTL